MILFLVLCAVSVSSGLAVDQLYSYGPSVGDKILNASDAESSDAIHLEMPFVLFGMNKTSLHVSRSCYFTQQTSEPCAGCVCTQSDS